ncbi:hypothetical protein ACEZ3G_08145 [Maribacter algicola]|uniref:Uncharacterized protein n=1 Tax=Meishania litoralis TaxID=3434685 RepID=A0ACC7LJK2_9FLAO
MMLNPNSTSLGFFTAVSLISFNETSTTEIIDKWERPLITIHKVEGSDSSVIAPADSKGYSINKLVENLKKLENFKNLPDNWNGYGGLGFEENFLDSIKEIIKDTSYQPEIFPTGRNSIQFEFSKGENFLEVEIFHDHAEYYGEIEGYEIEKNIPINSINSEINAFFRSF